ncbi:MAG TPA: hypothetical protein H9844_11075 [Candidatus Evtepia faecigallinarum]|nr:hypothetical protein [Candidatus Evtepia faecigallinarum]
MKRSPWMNLPFWGLVGTLALLIVHLLLTNHGSSILAIGFAGALYFLARDRATEVRDNLWLAKADAVVLTAVLVAVLCFSLCWDQQYGTMLSLGQEKDLSLVVMVSLLFAATFCFAQKDLARTEQKET